MNPLDMFTSKSYTFKKDIEKIINAGYKLTYEKELKQFEDVDNGVTIVDINGVEQMSFIPKGYETTFIFEDADGRAIRIDTSLVTKTSLDKLNADEAGTFQMATIKAQTARLNLDFMKVKTYLVEYSKGYEAYERKSLSDLDKQLEELSYF